MKELKKRKLIKIVQQYYSVFAIVVFLLFLKGGYSLFQILNPKGRSLLTVVDQLIPFTTFFVLFYVLYYPFIVLPLFIHLKKKTIFRKILAAMMFVTVCSFTTYALYQTEVERPFVQPEGLLYQLVHFIYIFDKPLNVFPSLHVSLTTLAFLVLWKFKRKIAYYSAPIAGGIVLSTVFIKQHYVVDVIGGLLLAIISYFIIVEWEFMTKLFSYWQVK